MNAPIIRGLRRSNESCYFRIHVRMNAPIIRGLRLDGLALVRSALSPDECPDY